MAEVANMIGLAGVACILTAYALLSFNIWRVDHARYVLLNMGGTAAVLFSIIYAWNWPGFMLNASWILISIYALWRICKNRGAA